MDEKVNEKNLKDWIQEHPILQAIITTEEVLWSNPLLKNFNDAKKRIPITLNDVIEAEKRLKRFSRYIARVFPETRTQKGIIESPLEFIPDMKKALEQKDNQTVMKDLLLKCDHLLPISGSIKARGGIYEVLKHAEDIAIRSGMLTVEDDYSVLAEPSFKKFFSDYSISVGSTGNLGLSIGIMSAELGFNVYVHMSADAKGWKKDLLREKGVTVIEYNADYSMAVAEGRRQAEQDEKMYFIDDENSKDLFLGYAVSALRLKKQLEVLEVEISRQQPLVVYLPCGVGGGPGGVAFGLKLVFKDNVHCYFAEPTHSPAMLLGLVTGLHDQVSVFDFGIDNKTEADGLAVGRPSGFVGKMMEEMISGIFTVDDRHLYEMLAMLKDTESFSLEPSAAAGFQGVNKVIKHMKEKENPVFKNAIHLVWATGGSMVPKMVHDKNYKKGKIYLSNKAGEAEK